MMAPSPSVETALSAFPIPDNPDPSSWSNDDFQTHGVPPRPHGPPDSPLYQAWSRMFGHQLRFIRYVPEVVEGGKWTDAPTRSHAGGVIVRPDPEMPAMVTRTSRFVTSPNWSGATLDAESNRTFRQIYGEWIVTKVTQPPDQGDGIFRCASWIGIDGQRHYLHATLPQIGTLESLIVDPTGASHTLLQAWTQWWAPNDPNAMPVFIRGFPLDFDNRIGAVVTVTDPHHVVCNLVNQDTVPPTIVCVKMRAPRIRNPLPSGPLLAERYTISGANVGWVLERPAVIGEPDNLDRLCNFGATAFSCCVAVETEEDGSRPVVRTLGTARFIRMFERRHRPERTVYLSMPKRTAEDGFSLRFGDVWSELGHPGIAGGYASSADGDGLVKPGHEEVLRSA